MTRTNRILILWGIATLACLGLGLGVLGTHTRIAGAVMTNGVIQSEIAPHVMQTDAGGVVAQLLVSEGQNVHQGDVLLRLNGDRLHSELAILTAQIDELKARAARLRAERDSLGQVAYDAADIDRAKTDETLKDLMNGQTRLFHARVATAQAKTAQITEQKRQIENAIIGEEQYLISVSTQIQLVQAELNDAETLRSKGFSPANRVGHLKKEIAGLTGTQGKLNASIARSRGKIAELNAALTQSIADRRERAIHELRDVMAHIAEKSEQRRNLLTQIDNLELRASVPGVIMSSNGLAEGSVIRPAAPLMTIVPVGGPYKVLTRLSPRDIDEVRLGQTAFLRFTSLDKQNTTNPEAYVATISPNTVAQTETSQAWYDVELKLPQTTQLPATLENGMPVEVFFQTTPRSPTGYLFGPFTNYFSKAMRD